VKEEAILTPVSLLTHGVMRRTDKVGVYTKWDVKDLKHSITARLSDGMKGQAGLFNQGMDVWAVVNRAFGIL
jgi:hypothetical protein